MNKEKRVGLKTAPYGTPVSTNDFFDKQLLTLYELLFNIDNTKNEKRRLPRQIYKAQKKKSNNSRMPPRSTKKEKTE